MLVGRVGSGVQGSAFVDGVLVLVEYEETVYGSAEVDNRRVGRLPHTAYFHEEGSRTDTVVVSRSYQIKFQYWHW